MRRILVVLAILASLFIPTLAAPAYAAGCQFQLGFKTLHDLIPTTVGNCQEDENHNPVNGDGLQHTTGGLLVWRKLDNWTAFTDGYHTWINGPQRLQERLNTDRFPWEVLNMAGKAASTVPGTPIDLGTILTSVVDYQAKEYDVYAMSLTVGSVLHVDFSSDKVSFILKLFVPGNSPQYFSAGPGNSSIVNGTELCRGDTGVYSCSASYAVPVTGVYNLVVQGSMPSMAYRLHVY